MAKIDFVPNDYIQEQESGRANFMYFLLLGAVMVGFVLTFSIIKVRQGAIAGELEMVNSKMASAGRQVAQLEELKAKSKAMMETMAMTIKLLEPVPRSVILAGLTNDLPPGVSLLEFKLTEETPKQKTKKQGSQYGKATVAVSSPDVPKENVIETHMEIRGIAPSDVEVAGFIANLSESILMDNVTLVESKEHNVEGTRIREFKLKATLKDDLMLSKDDISNIRAKRRESM